jgi:CRP-like cAMP-binding protein
MDFSLDKYHLKSSSLFDLLPREEAQLLKSKMIRKEYPKGEYLFKEGSYSKGVYIVRKGKVKIFQTNAEGKQSILCIYKKDDFFGYGSLLANEHHHVSAMAMDNVVVSFIPSAPFLTMLEERKHLAMKLLTLSSKEFSAWMNKMSLFSQYGVKERVALSLLILSKVYQRAEGDGKMGSISINRDDFAGFVGTAKETLVRMLRTFKDEGIITTKGTKITIIKHRALTDMIADM